MSVSMKKSQETVAEINQYTKGALFSRDISAKENVQQMVSAANTQIMYEAMMNTILLGRVGDSEQQPFSWPVKMWLVVPVKHGWLMAVA
ncbi:MULTISPECIES: hypothetical protein [unclassified Planococcus (in: firmicutes)]|uniref:hypothetical protein n=1 Tax=unclassified Planococcus (in: firmicutes) TaxID=2662419 RepID=UPI001CAA873F|nr:MULTISPECIES: hypothetical protein [unclassified Planococcus (in: firmicutes)]